MRISVVITVFNPDQYIEGLFLSIRDQTLKPYEVILVDDCSDSKASEVLCRRLCRIGIKTSLVLLEKNSGGPAIPRNKGVENASGEYIAFLDQDDMWMPAHLEMSIGILNERDQVFISSGYFLVNNACTKRLGHYQPDEGRITRQRLRLSGNVVALSSVVMKRELLTQYKFREDLIWEDFELWYRLAGEKTSQMTTGAFTNVIYRVVQGSRSNGVEKSIRGLVEMMDYWELRELISSIWYMAEWSKVLVKLIWRRLASGQ